MSFYFAVAQQLHDTHFQYAQRSPDPPKARPASKRVVDSLKNIKLSEEDFAEPTNRTCAICLDEQANCDSTCKLLCGHVYHTQCMKGWLQKNSTCPTCRFDLDTRDPEYEHVRKSHSK